MFSKLATPISFISVKNVAYFQEIGAREEIRIFSLLIGSRDSGTGCSEIKNEFSFFDKTIFNFVSLILTFSPCMLLHLLYLKQTYALILKHTYTSTFIKTLNLF
jgi:hypothetical protein